MLEFAVLLETAEKLCIIGIIAATFCDLENVASKITLCLCSINVSKITLGMWYILKFCSYLSAVVAILDRSIPCLAKKNAPL